MKVTPNGDGRFEIGAIHNTGETDAENKTVVERCDEPETCEYGENQTHTWSVFEHQARGGVECVADCETKEMADTIRYALEMYAKIERRG